MVTSERRTSNAIVAFPALRNFAQSLRGNVILPDDPRYEAERGLFNAAIDRRPVAIAQPADAHDVARAIAFARENELPIAVRGGGHHSAGYGMIDGGLLIDLALRKQIYVDPDKRVAFAGAGLRAGEYITAPERFGLISPIGDASHTGFGGLSLGGGYGYVSGKLGLAIDNVLAHEIVTADGRILRASADENPDLFWALRGGSGNFGVVTSFEYRLTPLTQVYGGMLIYPFPMARDVLHLYRDLTMSAPDELTTYAGLATTPDGPVVALIYCYAGNPTDGERLLAPARALGPVADMGGPMPYSAMTKFADGFAPLGKLRDDRWTNIPTAALTDSVIDELIGFADPSRSLGNFVVIKQLNGVATRVAPDATAFPHRMPHYSIVPIAEWTDPAETAANVAWVEAVDATVRPLAIGSYVNGAGASEPAGNAYGVNLARLAAVKAQYDPENVFSHNHNIAPAT